MTYLPPDALCLPRTPHSLIPLVSQCCPPPPGAGFTPQMLALRASPTSPSDCQPEPAHPAPQVLSALPGVTSPSPRCVPSLLPLLFTTLTNL